jgi:sn-glycerol 3-phosphate transport system substrate-binding protein
VWGDTPAAFTSGQAAMIYHTTGNLSSILKNATFKVGVGYLPSGPANDEGTGYGTPTGGGNLYIFDNGDEAVQEAAWLWIQYLASDEIQSDWGVATGYIAATQGAWEIDPLKSVTEEFPQYLVARDQLEIAVKEFDAYRSIDIQNIINTTLSGIFSGSTPLADASKALEDAQTQIDALLVDYLEE